MSVEDANCRLGQDAVVSDADFLLSSYAYALPDRCIAQAPDAHRDGCRLMCLDVAAGKVTGMEHHVFADLGRLLPAGSLLIANNARVFPARIRGRRPGGGALEFLLLTPPPLLAAQSGASGWLYADAKGLIRPASRVRIGAVYDFFPDFCLEVREKGSFGQIGARLHWRGKLEEIFAREGMLPLPPYIRRPAGAEDEKRYQTVYADENRAGAVAAPTAGLHFTLPLREDLLRYGHEWREITLYVGYGTFSPVREDDIRNHRMHAEYVEIAKDVARAVAQAKRDGRPVVAVGTTSVRALEGAFAQTGKMDGYRGITDIFLHPGKEMRVVDGLITNFHLPQSTLMMLVSVLTGRRGLLRAYAEAVKTGYRFFSYGDAMLIRQSTFEIVPSQRW